MATETEERHEKELCKSDERTSGRIAGGYELEGPCITFMKEKRVRIVTMGVCMVALPATPPEYQAKDYGPLACSRLDNVPKQRGSGLCNAFWWVLVLGSRFVFPVDLRYLVHRRVCGKLGV